MLPNDRTSPPGSATATAIFSESTSKPRYRISFIGRLLSLVALRYGQPIASVIYGLAIGAGRPILTSRRRGSSQTGGHEMTYGSVRGACLALMLASTVAAGAADPRADLVLTGGTVVTLDPARPRATALAVRGGRIVRVGDDADVRALAGPRTQTIDLAGRTVLPGLADAHVHTEGVGAALETLSLVGAASLDEAVERVRRAAAALPPGEWLLGRGWDQNDWPDKRFPTAAALAAVSAGHPVHLTPVDGHAGWANSKAMELAGITASTVDPTGGRIL